MGAGQITSGLAVGAGRSLLRDVVVGGRSWEVSPRRFQEAVVAGPRVLARACERGFTGTFTVAGRPRVVSREVPGLGWLDVVVVRSWFEGVAPRYGDWQILGRVEGRDGRGVRVEPAAGTRLDLGAADLVGVEVGVCGHCRTHRVRRVRTVLLASTRGQALTCVGTECLAQVLGVRSVFLGDADLAGDLGWGVEDWLPMFTVESVVAAGYAAAAAFGWVPGTSVWSTARRVRAALGGDRSEATRRTRAEMAPHLGQGWRVARSLAHSLAPGRVDPLVASVAPSGTASLEEVPVIVAGLGALLVEQSSVEFDVRSWV